MPETPPPPPRSNQHNKLPTHLMAAIINPPSSASTPLPPLGSGDTGMIDLLAAAFNTSFLAGQLKQRDPMKAHNVVEVHSANYKYLDELLQTGEKTADIQRGVLQVLYTCVYPLVMDDAVDDDDDDEQHHSSGEPVL